LVIHGILSCIHRPLITSSNTPNGPLSITSFAGSPCSSPKVLAADLPPANSSLVSIPPCLPSVYSDHCRYRSGRPGRTHRQARGSKQK
jgi:hypothetical protein